LLVADGNYFKVLTKERKAEPHHGYIKKCKIDGYEHLDVILIPNYQALFHNPAVQDKIEMGISTLGSHIAGNHVDIGTGICHYEYYPSTLSSIEQYLNSLHQYPALTVDIEAFSLLFYEAGIGTISFAWDQHNGGGFAVDYVEESDQMKRLAGFHGKQVHNPEIKALLREFFETYQGRLTYHNAAYDVKVLIYELFMDNLLDTEGMLNGLEVMYRNIDDTKIITYLATNSTSGNNLALKHNAFEFAGNYAQDDIHDIRLIPLPELLHYNVVDCLATWYVFNKYYLRMKDDEQLPIYDDIMLPSLTVITNMELTGMPMDMDEVHAVKAELEAIVKIPKEFLRNSSLVKQLEELEAIVKIPKEFLRNSSLVKQLEWNIAREAMIARNAELKKKVKPINDFKMEFNPASPKQLQKLLYEQFGLPVIDYTDTKQPSTGKDTLKKLRNHLISEGADVDTDEYIEVLDALITISEVDIILNTFIKTFIERAILKDDGIYYLHGNFNLGGTVSGRLSSSKPNMQNIPSSSKYAKHIKRCFIAPPGWVMMGADFASLEDRISALTTKDPNKLKVYLDGYDGHCLRAYSYFRDQMPDILDTVESINSIEEKYPMLRQDSKGPTFALTYQGTWKTLVNNIGMTEEEAKAIEANYHILYSASDIWVQERLSRATVDGFITVAFGLRVRTPILGQTILGSRTTPYAAQAEGRTAGNALGQSYGLLNNRAGIEFRRRLMASPYRLDILPISQIHDAQYFLVRESLEVTEWFNRNLVECMEWQELPEIQHDLVKLGGAVEVYHPNWSKKTTLPNNASQEEIKELFT